METGGFGLAGQQWRWEAMGDCLELSYGGLQFREREIIRIEILRVFSFYFYF